MLKTYIYSSTRDWIRRRKSGDAARYFTGAEKLAKGTRVFLCARVSHAEGKSDSNRKRRLEQQLEYLRREAARLGLIVAGEYGWIGSGRDPSSLARIGKLAKRAGASAIVWHTVSRAVRHPKYHSNTNPNLQALDSDMAEAVHFADGLTLATILDPGATPKQERSAHIKRGRPGRPRKLRRGSYRKPEREWLLADVRRLRIKGYPLRRIAAATGVPEATVRLWLKHAQS